MPWTRFVLRVSTFAAFDAGFALDLRLRPCCSTFFAVFFSAIIVLPSLFSLAFFARTLDVAPDVLALTRLDLRGVRRRLRARLAAACLLLDLLRCFLLGHHRAPLVDANRVHCRDARR